MEVAGIDIVTGKKTSFVATSRRALRAMRNAKVPFAVIGATALGARGLPRFTKDLDLVVTTCIFTATNPATKAISRAS